MIEKIEKIKGDINSFSEFAGVEYDTQLLKIENSLNNNFNINLRMSTSSKDLADTYQEKTDIEHILDAPDTYIGSVESDEINGWTINEKDEMTHKEFSWIGGFYKMFDEGIVNCRDHAVRLMQKLVKREKNILPVRNIEITVDRKTGVITMMNDGNGVDVAKHPENKLWIPEMIFGHLRTSTNYKKDEKKIVGGKNGFGFKLVLIYSKWGKFETVDHIRHKKYIQKFEDNLNIIKNSKDAKIIADNIAEQLERRASIRRTMKRAIQSALRLGAQGIKIVSGGRLGGAEIARIEWYREGLSLIHI